MTEPSRLSPRRPASTGLIVMAIVLVLAAAAPDLAYATPGSHPGAPGSTSPRLSLDDAAAFQAFVDPILEGQISDLGIPGAVLAVVAHGELLYSRGYGSTHLDGGQPVDPEVTLFDVGSVAKLLTATAAMQLVEQGRLDLHTDVNDYLTAFQVPAAYDEPVTLAHLLTHTAGFDDRFYLGLLADEPESLQPLEENLRRHLPPRVRPPGQEHQYSNAGLALAGHLVEVVSGQSFTDYVQTAILDPMEMTRTTYDPLSPSMEDRSGAHVELFGETAEEEPWLVHQRPAGGLWTTGHDMARFMLAHLSDGASGDHQLLRPETLATMHATQFEAHPAVSGFTYGFFEHRVEGRRGIHHGGDWLGFHSLVYLLPDEAFGLFVSYNHPAGNRARYDLIESVLDAVFPAAEAAAGADTTTSASDLPYAGLYRTNRQDRHTFAQFAAMLANPTVRVTTHGAGEITTSMSIDLMPETRWREVEPGIFREVDGENTLAFDVDPDGRVTHLHLGWPLLLTMEPIAWYERASTQVGLLAIILLACASTILFPLGWAVGRLRGGNRGLGRSLSWARRVAGVSAFLVLAFVAGIVVMAAVDIPGMMQAPISLRLVLVLPIVAAIGAVGAAMLSAWTWRLREGSLAGRVHLTVVSAALVAFVVFAYAWGLLGLNV